MSDLERTMAASASGMAAQASRIRLTTENIANADTPGTGGRRCPSRRPSTGRTIPAAVATGPVQLDRSELVRIYEPGNPLAGADGSYLGSNVDLVVEIADAREANRSYEANLKMFDQARQMASSLLGLLRR